jgi:hypothetical protein
MQKALISAEAEIAQVARTLRQFRIVRHHHSALAGGNDLVGAKAEAFHRPDAASAAAMILGPVRFGGVLDDSKPNLLANSMSGFISAMCP